MNPDNSDNDLTQVEDFRWRMLVWALPLAAVSSLGGMLNLINLPAAVAVDYWIHSIVAITFLLATIWILTDRRWGKRVDVLLVILTSVAIGSRLVFALFEQGYDYSVYELLLPFAGYVPLVFVISFALLPRAPAILLSMSFYLVTTGGVAVFVLRNLSDIHNNGAGVALLQQFIFGHAIYIAVLYVIPAITRDRQRLAAERDELARQNKLHLQRIEQDAIRQIAMQAAGMGNWSIDLPERKLNWDAQSSLLFGLPHEQPRAGLVQALSKRLVNEPNSATASELKTDFELALTGAKELDCQLSFYREGDRRLRTVRARARLLQGPDAQPLRLAGIVWDITEHVRMAKFLEMRSEQLERSNAELEHFAYIASHDLQTPLRGISGFAQFLKLDYADQLGNKGGEYVDQIISGVENMRGLITGLLDLSRASQIDTEPRPLDLNEAINIAIERNQAAIDDSDAVIDRSGIPNQLPVMGHAGPLAQLLQNLMANAIKFQPEGAQPVIQLTATKTQNSLQISVADNGLGIPEDEQALIFDVFRRASSSENIEGSGIGLAVCQRIVKRHGGKLWLDSTAGEGTTFHFTLNTPDEQSPKP